MKKLKKDNLTNKTFLKLFIFFGLLLILVFPFRVACAQQSGASLILSPSSGSYQAGSTFSVAIAVRSEQEAINAAEALLRFDPNIVNVRTISKANSIFVFWPIEPVFSNSEGTVRFTGGTTGQYSGARGTIITITFEALREGTLSLSFSEGRILAADGLGTDITDRLIGGSYTISGTVAPDPTPDPIPTPTPDPTPIPTPSLEIPSEPRIHSSTHPNPENWYNNNSPEFSWDVSTDISAVRLIFSQSTTTQPNLIYDPAVSSYSLENIEDGVWYFALQLKNQLGWGRVSRFRVQIDTKPPDPFRVEVDNEDDVTNPTPIFRFETKDHGSGIAYYEIILNDELYAEISPEEVKDGFYRPSPLPPKDYSLNIKAVDRAGNHSSASAQFSISGIFFEIDEIPSKIIAGEVLEIKGRTLSGIIVRFYFEKEDGEIIVREIISDSEGNFQFQEVLERGEYFVWVEAEDERGALSEPIQKHFLEIAPDRITIFLLIFLIIFILVGGFIIWFLWKKISEDKEKIKKEEVKKIIEAKQKAYNELKEKISEQIDYLEGKVDLSRSEARLLKELKATLNNKEE